MSNTPANPFDQTVTLPAGPLAVNVRSGLTYGDAQHSVDVYLPVDLSGRTAGAAPPAVVLATGYPDPGFAARFGQQFKDTEAYRSWARLLASHGLAAVVYTNTEPAADLLRVLAWVADNPQALGIRGERLGLWAVSGNVPNALAALAAARTSRAAGALAAATLLYGFMLDSGVPEAPVATAAAGFGFVDGAAGLTAADLSADVPLLVVRAGGDVMPGLNATIDIFAAAALAANLRLSLINYPAGAHAFDLTDSSPAAQAVLTAVVQHLVTHLAA